ncbi:PQQ-binding-like beta-propeller repeat protein [Desulfoscipio gibsoniae]|uniref:Pyrrolo-quinoline quinone repeat domain-containing protein n=1 Tax=Desulfoscipio gibsoniae DSM 7213 TaxID=767817 RepID=R4KM05_9FIRM|nr:PQQ-binding-like beta-propeller repeat protein [Desulfoscipio gibsoniae]AGL03719.1 hypothetical protein Desgi_4491 [Desulfoscipio gibsoniae DSM 7213]
MSDLWLHGLGQISMGDTGVIPIEGLTPIIASDEIKGIGLPFAHHSLRTSSNRKGVNHYHDGKVYVLHSSGVNIYDAESGEVIADNVHTTSSALMIPDLAATDGSYFLAQGSSLYKYALGGTLIWETPNIGSPYCIAVETSGVHIGVTESSTYYVKKFNRNNGNVMWTSSSLNSYIYALAVNSNTVIVADQSYKIYRLNPSNGSTVYSYTIPNSRNAYALAIEPGTNHFYSIDNYYTLRKHSYQTGEPIFERSSANTTTVYNIFIDSENNIYTVSNREITKLDNQLAGFIWREDHNISGNPINGFGLDKEQGKIYVLRQHSARILSTDKEWSDFIPHQFEGVVNSIDVDITGNFYGASDDWTARKFNALGEQQWVYRHNLALNFVKADKNGNVYIADTNRTLKKLNPYGVEQWSCSITGTTGAVTDLVVNSEGVIVVSITYFYTSGSKDYLAKISPEGTLLEKREIGTSGVFRKLHLWDDRTVLAFNKLYDIDTLRTIRYFSTARAIFGRHGDFLFGVYDDDIRVFNKYSGGQIHSFEVSDINITNFYLRAVQGLDGAVYAWDNDKTLVKFNEKGEEFWRYKAVEKIADVKVDDEHNIYLATGYYIEKLTQTFGIEGYDKN